MIQRVHRDPVIHYPCRWTYRLIGPSEGAMRRLVESLLQGAEHELSLSRVSATGKYTSLKLTLVVRNEIQRLMLYRRLGRDASIRYVL